MHEITCMLGLEHQKHIEAICKPLASMKIKSFIIYMIFNNGNVFILSNAFSFLNAYSEQKWYEEDYTYTTLMILPRKEGYYLCRESNNFSSDLKANMENKYQMYPAYSILRHHTEGTLVCSAIPDHSVDSNEFFFKQTINAFENFCISFLDKYIGLIINLNPLYKHSFILTNEKLRAAIIKQKFIQTKKLTFREKECLWHATQGKSVKEIAKDLKISPYTVEEYFCNIKNALNCKTVIEAVIEGMHRGIVGKISNC